MLRVTRINDPVLIGKLTALELEKIAEYFRLKGLLSSPSRGTDAILNQREVYVRNDYAGDVPAYGCMQVIGTAEVGQNYLKVSRPADGVGTAGWYVFNGPNPIAQNGFGLAYAGPLCQMLTDGSTITAGAVWSPVASQWTIAPNGQLFVASGSDAIATNVMKGFFKGGGGASLYKATMKSTWSSGVVNCDIYSIDGTTFTDTTIDANVYDGLSIFTSLTTGSSMLVLLQAGKYYAIQAPCP